MSTDPATLRALEKQLGRIWAAIPLDRQVQLLANDDGLDSLIAALRACADAQERPAVDRAYDCGCYWASGNLVACPEHSPEQARISARLKAEAPAAPAALPQTCREPAPDCSGRNCDKPKGHSGEHWTFGGSGLTWPAAPAAPAIAVNLWAGPQSLPEDATDVRIAALERKVATREEHIRQLIEERVTVSDDTLRALAREYDEAYYVWTEDVLLAFARAVLALRGLV